MCSTAILSLPAGQFSQLHTGRRVASSCCLQGPRVYFSCLGMTQHCTSLLLVLPAGVRLHLTYVVLVDCRLPAPPAQPAGLLPPRSSSTKDGGSEGGGALWLQDVRVLVDAPTLQQQLAYFRGLVESGWAATVGVWRASGGRAGDSWRQYGSLRMGLLLAAVLLMEHVFDVTCALHTAAPTTMCIMSGVLHQVPSSTGMQARQPVSSGVITAHQPLPLPWNHHLLLMNPCLLLQPSICDAPGWCHISACELVGGGGHYMAGRGSTGGR
jgi:hypothetical protein